MLPELTQLCTELHILYQDFQLQYLHPFVAWAQLKVRETRPGRVPPDWLVGFELEQDSVSLSRRIDGGGKANGRGTVYFLGHLKRAHSARKEFLQQGNTRAKMVSSKLFLTAANCKDLVSETWFFAKHTCLRNALRNRALAAQSSGKIGMKVRVLQAKTVQCHWGKEK